MEQLTLKQRIENTLSAGESHFREFKTALKGPPGQKVARPVKEVCEDIAEALVAFANADGGELLIGVEDDGTVTGVPHDEEDVRSMMHDWKARVQADPIDTGSGLPMLLTEVVVLPLGKVLFFAVSKGTKRIYQLTNGRCVRRRDKASEPANVHQLLFEAQETESRAFDQQFIDGALVSDLDSKLLLMAAQQYPFGMTPEFYLQQVGLGDYGLGGMRLRRATLLLFAKDMQRWHPRSQIRVLKVAGTELKSGADYNVVSDELRAGNIFELLQSSWEVLRPFLVSKTRFGEDARFDQQYLFPEQACREALINAIAHRAYNIMNPVEVFIFDDRMEIRSPGSLLSTLTIQGLEQLQGMHESRNPLIARVLRESKYMRELGEGMKRIFESVEQRDIEKPKLHTDTTSFSITLFNRTIYTPQQELWLSVFRDYQLTPLQKRIVVAGMGDQPLSRHDVVSAMRNQDRDTYDSTVSRLRKLGILIQIRRNSSASWIARSQGISKDTVHRFKVVVPGTERPAAPAEVPERRPLNPPLPRIEKPSIGPPERRVFFQFRAGQGKMNESDLQRLFQRCGVVERIDLPVWPDGTQRGFGFAWYETQESARLAVAQLHGVVVAGQKLVVEAYDTGR